MCLPWLTRGFVIRGNRIRVVLNLARYNAWYYNVRMYFMIMRRKSDKWIEARIYWHGGVDYAIVSLFFTKTASDLVLFTLTLSFRFHVNTKIHWSNTFCAWSLYTISDHRFLNTKLDGKPFQQSIFMSDVSLFHSLVVSGPKLSQPSA